MGFDSRYLEMSKTVESGKEQQERKSKGIFYTPPAVVDYMTDKLLGSADLVKNPYVKILDPSCGTGHFLLKVFEVLKRRFEICMDEILKSHRELEPVLAGKGLDRFIIENSLWGADIDEEALDFAGQALMKAAGCACRPNLVCCDSLVASAEADNLIALADFGQDGIWHSRYDYIIGNPPYIGHKKVSAVYKKTLQQHYPGIYKDKSDISFCFFKRGIDLLSKGGTLSFITSRYFLEGPSAEGLRKFVRENSAILEIVDFFGYPVFKDVGVAACIITLKNGCHTPCGEVLRYQAASDVAKEDGLFSSINFERFRIEAHMLKDEGWLLLPPEKQAIYLRLEEAGTHTLGQLFDSYQGIITGCDKAFIMDADTAERERIESRLLKPWIKNSNVERYFVKPSEYLLIYADDIENEAACPNAVGFIGKYRERLEERRECKNGVRKWFQLQWGRSKAVFEARKLVYPYKSASSRFAIDDGDNFCSADVYSLQLKKGVPQAFTLEYAAAILNSKLFEFYFKCYAKKISDEMYDYYPNTVLRLKLNMSMMNETICRLSHKLYQSGDMQEKEEIIQSVDRELYKQYGLNEKQIEIIERTVKR